MKFYSLVSQDGQLLFSSESRTTVEKYVEVCLMDVYNLLIENVIYDALLEAYMYYADDYTVDLRIVTSYMDMPNV